jgi:tRNA(Ile2) C34 agmatinyltransferase TiaS
MTKRKYHRRIEENQSFKGPDAAERECFRCGESFQSKGKGNRHCPKCREWLNSEGEDDRYEVVMKEQYKGKME